LGFIHFGSVVSASVKIVKIHHSMLLVYFFNIDNKVHMYQFLFCDVFYHFAHTAAGLFAVPYAINIQVMPYAEVRIVDTLHNAIPPHPTLL
jgi:hypothetical protein